METLTQDAALQQKMVAALRSCSLFRALDAETIPQLLKAAEVVCFSPGDSIVRKGEASDAFFVVAEGDALIYAESPLGERREIGRLRQGAAIGEIGLLLGEPRTASVSAEGTVLTAKFRARAFEQMFQKIPGFGMALSGGLAYRLSQVSGSVPLPEYDLVAEPPRPEVLELLPISFIQRHRVIPLRLDGQKLTLGFVDPASSQVLGAAQAQLPAFEIYAVRVTSQAFDHLMAAHGGVAGLGAPAPAVSDTARSPRLDPMLERAVAEGASDLHLSPGYKPRWRIDGDMKEIADAGVLGETEALDLLAPAMAPRHHEQFKELLDVDLAYAIPGLARFRVNVFRQSRGVAAVLRHIPGKVLTFEQLGLPPVVAELCACPKGLVLVTGPTGSGKSTTLAAMIDHINKTRRGHIVTIEDPIEFVHQSQSCLVNQRELGGHASSYARALRASLREDPDVVLVGEMRDAETVALALEAANTGHLVLATLHTNTAVSAVDRIVDQFPSDQQAQVRSELGDVLRGVLAQTLCKKLGGGRVMALEILVVNQAVANLIREQKTVQIPGSMQSGRSQGMTLLNDELMRLVETKKIDLAEAQSKAVDKNDLMRRFRSGVTLAQEPGTPGAFRVMQVEPYSPGAEAGLSRGDLIVELDGKPITYSLDQMRVVFRTDGKHQLTVEKGGKRRTVPFELKHD